MPFKSRDYSQARSKTSSEIFKQGFMNGIGHATARTREQPLGAENDSSGQ